MQATWWISITMGEPTYTCQRTCQSALSCVVLNAQCQGLVLLLSGLPADGTIAAEVAFMFNEWYKPASCLEFPRGGSQAIVQALVR